MKIGTHDGAFHCDEALACWMLHQTSEFKHAEITRTRNPDILKEMDIVVDVGAEYDPTRHRYDHHQKEFTTTLDAEHTTTKLSSAGLVYKHFGKEVLQEILGKREEEEINKLYMMVYDGFIEEIDAVDNGVSCYPPDILPKYKISTTLSARVARLNPNWNDKTLVPDEQFKKAMAIAGEEMRSIVLRIGNAILPAATIVRHAIADRLSVDESGKIMSLEESGGLPWKEHLFDLCAEEGELAAAARELLYVLYPDSSGGWRIQCVPVKAAGFENRKGLPVEWCGLRDQVLSDKTGVEGCIFIHANGFIGGAKTREAALKLAQMAVKA